MDANVLRRCGRKAQGRERVTRNCAQRKTKSRACGVKRFAGTVLKTCDVGAAPRDMGGRSSKKETRRRNL